MEFRFVFRDPEGNEVGVPTAGHLASQVEMGAVHEDTPLFDTITGEWSPARDHPVFRLILEELDRPLGKTSAPELPSGQPPSTGSPVPGPPMAVPASPDLEEPAIAPAAGDEPDMVREFLEARERERREEGLRDAGREEEVPVVDPGQGSLARQRPEGRAGASMPPRRKPSGTRNAAGSGPARAAGRKDRGRGRGPRLPRGRRVRGDGSRRRTGLIRGAVVVALAAAAWAVAEWQPRAAESSSETLDTPGATLPPRPAGPLAGGLGYDEPEVFRDMTSGMEALQGRMRLGDPPAVWMAGAYLGDAGRYPEVTGYWRRYLAFVDSLRDREESIYREGLQARLEESGIQGRVLAVRAARELQDFRADSLGRVRRYDAMKELADAALSLHGFLEEHARTLRYAALERLEETDSVVPEPVSSTVRTGVWERVEVLLSALDRVAGPDPERRTDVTREVAGLLEGTATGG